MKIEGLAANKEYPSGFKLLAYIVPIIPAAPVLYVIIIGCFKIFSTCPLKRAITKPIPPPGALGDMTSIGPVG